MTETVFDPITTIRAVVAEGRVRTPAEIAAEVAARTPDSDLRAAYERALRDSVARVVVNDRAAAKERVRVAGAVRPSARSAKRAAIRDAHADYLAQLVSVGGRSLTIGECGYDDLIQLAADRTEQAKRLVAAGDTYARLAAALREAGVATVAELPREAVTAALA